MSSTAFSKSVSEMPIAEAEAYPRPFYAWYVVCVCLLIYVLAYVDRQILSLLVEPIKRDLGISDTQMSLLLGFAFAFFYTLVGLPVGRLADRTNRRNMVMLGVVIWSAATAFCGLARNYGQLFLGRMGVGLGEACLNPAVVPMLSDYFPKEKLGRALAVYMLGISIGGGLATVVGGAYLPYLTAEELLQAPVIGAVRPWQVVLLMLGASGIVMTALLLTVREPARRGQVQRDAHGKVINLPLKSVLSHLRAYRWAYIALIGPLIASGTMSFGLGYWIPSFFQRSFGLSTADAGRYLSVFGGMSMLIGAASVIGGGFLVDYLGKRYYCGHLWSLLAGLLLIVPGFGLFALMPSPELSIALLVPALVGNGILQASGVTSLMAVAPSQMKSQVAALSFFVINLIGAALGPTLIAVLTDAVFGDEAMLRYSISIVALVVGGMATSAVLFGREAYRALKMGAAR